jgi:hypothetical protein
VRLVPFAIAVIAACASEPAANNGVNDVRAACDLRSAWSTPGASACLACQTVAILQRCECEDLREYSARCLEQADARRAEASCTGELDACIRGCIDDDCACRDACYADAPACRRVSSARDGCVAEVCAAPCGAGGSGHE